MTVRAGLVIPLHFSREVIKSWTRWETCNSYMPLTYFLIVQNRSIWKWYTLFSNILKPWKADNITDTLNRCSLEALPYVCSFTLQWKHLLNIVWKFLLSIFKVLILLFVFTIKFHLNVQSFLHYYFTKWFQLLQMGSYFSKAL